jgi:hypothetical protein
MEEEENEDNKKDMVVSGQDVNCQPQSLKTRKISNPAKEKKRNWRHRRTRIQSEFHNDTTFHSCCETWRGLSNGAGIPPVAILRFVVIEKARVRRATGA